MKSGQFRAARTDDTFQVTGHHGHYFGQNALASPYLEVLRRPFPPVDAGFVELRAEELDDSWDENGDALARTRRVLVRCLRAALRCGAGAGPGGR